MKSIVVVDDERENLDIILELLHSCLDVKSSLHAFVSPVEALEYLKTHSCDLLITDYLMPGLNGAKLVRKIRQDHSLHEFPIIIHSGSNINEIRSDLGNGFNLEEVKKGEVIPHVDKGAFSIYFVRKAMGISSLTETIEHILN